MGHLKAGAVDHRTPRQHVCDRRCGPHHHCPPLAAAPIRHVHFVLQGPFEKGVRRLALNPFCSLPKRRRRRWPGSLPRPGSRAGLGSSGPLGGEPATARRPRVSGRDRMGGPLDGQGRDLTDRCAAQPRRWGGDPQPRQPTEQSREGDLGVHAGRRRAQAEVRPAENAKWGLGDRARSSSSARGNTTGSRLAAAKASARRPPAGTGHPSTSTSTQAVTPVRVVGEM